MDDKKAGNRQGRGLENWTRWSEIHKKHMIYVDYLIPKSGGTKISTLDPNQ